MDLTATDPVHASEVGVRELKAKLSEHLAHVKAGGVVTVTERGKPVARLVPVEQVDVSPELASLIASGEVSWSGRRLPALHPLPLMSGKARGNSAKASEKSMSQLVSEGREDRV
jgi:prevent-host-death family protein